MPESLALGDQAMTLNGMGIRKATMLKVKVYVAGLYLVGKSGDEYGRGLHVDRHGAGRNEGCLECLVVLPDPAVGGVNGAGPVVEVVLPYRVGDGTLKIE